MARIINLSERNKQFGASRTEVLYDLQRTQGAVVILTYGLLVARIISHAGQGDRLGGGYSQIWKTERLRRQKMNIKTEVWEKECEVDLISSGLCPIAVFGISGVEPSGYAASKFTNQQDAF